MSELSPDARRLIDATRDVDAPGAGDRARLHAAIQVRLASPAAAAAAAPAAATTTAGAALAKLAAGGVILAALGVGAARARPRAPAPTAPAAAARSAPSPSTTAAPAPPSPERPTPAPPDPVRVALVPAPPRRAHRRAPTVVPSPAEAAPPPPVVGVAAPPAAPDAFDHEFSLLRDAQVALDRRRHGRAIELLDQYAAAHPGGTLGTEALTLRVLTLCALGRPDEARGFAARLLNEAPDSPSAGRVRSSCVGEGARDDSATGAPASGH